MTKPTVPCEIRNDKALILWAFMAIWLSFLVIFTGIAIHDGGIPQVGAWALPILGLFWLGGLAAGSWAASHARIRVTFAAGSVSVRERWPFSVRERRFRARELAPPRVVEGKDSEGDPYFTCVLELPDGRRVTIGEGSQRLDMEAVRDQWIAMIR